MTIPRRLELWLDANLSHRLCAWIASNHGVSCISVRDRGLRHSDDGSILEEARRNGVVLLTKDVGLARLAEMQSSPSRVILVSCGNLSNPQIKQLLSMRLQSALDRVEAGSHFVEIPLAVA